MIMKLSFNELNEFCIFHEFFKCLQNQATKSTVAGVIPLRIADNTALSFFRNFSIVEKA